MRAAAGEAPWGEALVSPCASVRSEVSSTSGADDVVDVAVAAAVVAAGGVVGGLSVVAVAVVAASFLEARG